MTTIQIQVNDDSIVQQIINYLKRFKVPVKVLEGEIPDLTDEQTWVQSQLTEKYVKTGEWDKMDDEDRQDAALGEMMLFSRQQSDYLPLSVAESKAYRTQLRQKLTAHAEY